MRCRAAVCARANSVNSSTGVLPVRTIRTPEVSGAAGASGMSGGSVVVCAWRKKGSPCSMTVMPLGRVRGVRWLHDPAMSICPGSGAQRSQTASSRST